MIMVVVEVADLNFNRVTRWWLSWLSSRFRAKSCRELKPKWISGLSWPQFYVWKSHYVHFFSAN